MSEIVKVVGTIKLGGQELDVYSSRLLAKNAGRNTLNWR